MALVPRVHLTKLAQFLGQESVQKRLPMRVICQSNRPSTISLPLRQTFNLLVEISIQIREKIPLNLVDPSADQADNISQRVLI
jgi:hypothetical protein